MNRNDQQRGSDIGTAPDPSTLAEQPSLVDSPTVRVLALCGVGFFTLSTAVLSIWKEFYKEVKGFKPFADYEATRTQEIEAAYRVGLRNPKEVPPLVKAAQEKSQSSIAAGMRQIGIPENPISGTIARCRRLTMNNFADIALRTMASLGFALGSWLLFQRSFSRKPMNAGQDSMGRHSHANLSQNDGASHQETTVVANDNNTPPTQVQTRELDRSEEKLTAHANGIHA